MLEVPIAIGDRRYAVSSRPVPGSAAPVVDA